MAAIISVASCTAFTFGEAARSRRALYTSISCWPRWKPSALSVYAAASSKVTLGAEGKADNKRPARGITKPKPVSPALQAFLGVKEIPRTQALKQIWAYIKEKNLQNTIHIRDGMTTYGYFWLLTWSQLASNSRFGALFENSPNFASTKFSGSKSFLFSALIYVLA
ncbi:hypothetical protein AXF42_Ash012880 [Apostasia shenzhenica]|uniref:SWIB domain-containing protein n=1 Tax=Apostasia shenzhenica TaxID=1088818 RepID=A0A2I0ARI3_9ASPA|nr:hypothetical protein AXF42_Ash012880 [Apostasia shenzhenica]